MEFWKKYRHVGYSHAGVGKGWKSIVEKAIVDIEKVMWVRWLPFWAKRLIHFLATDNSVVRVKYQWAHRLRNHLTGCGQMIRDIKDKYASLRIYATAGKEMQEIIDRAVKECDETCEACGSKDNVQCTDTSWMYNYCDECRKKMK